MNGLCHHHKTHHQSKCRPQQDGHAGTGCKHPVHLRHAAELGAAEDLHVFDPGEDLATYLIHVVCRPGLYQNEDRLVGIDSGVILGFFKGREYVGRGGKAANPTGESDDARPMPANLKQLPSFATPSFCL